MVPGSETLRRGKPFCACGELWPCTQEERPRGRHYQFTCMGHGHPESGNRPGCPWEPSGAYCACGEPWPCLDADEENP